MASAMAISGDLDIISICKKNWLQINSVSKEEELQNASSLTNLLSTYSKLRQIPKFVSKLFLAVNETLEEDSAGTLLNNGLIYSSFLESFAKQIFMLPIGQTLELWGLFNDNYEKNQLPRNSSASHEAAAFLTAQLFSTFLLHARVFEDSVFPVIRSKVENLMKDTSQLLCKIPDVLTFKESKSTLLKYSVFLLCHAYTEISLTFNAYGEDAASWPVLKNEDDILDFSMLHPCMVCCSADDCLLYLNGENKLFSYLMMKLLAQKAKFLVTQQCLDKTTKDHLKRLTTVLFTTVAAGNISAGSSWDMNVSTLSISNCDVAVWSLLLKDLPLLIDFAGHKELGTLCDAMVDILVQEDNCRLESFSVTKVQSVVSKFITSSFFIESKSFQSAFVTAVWKYSIGLLRAKKRSSSCSELKHNGVKTFLGELCNSTFRWEKYAETIPKCTADETEINTMWLCIQKTANLLNDFLSDSGSLKGKLKVVDTLHLFKLVNYLPLEYLLPGNQMRCVLGLSLLLFLLGSQEEDSEELLQALEEVSKALIVIFEGVRSIWLFDLVKAAPYLKTVVGTVERLLQMQKSGTSSSGCHWPKKLLEHLFNLSTRNTDSLLAIEEYVSELTSDITENTSSILAVLTLLQRLVDVLQRPYLQPKYKEVTLRLSLQACSSITKCMKHQAKEKANAEIYPLLVNCYTGLIKLAVNPTCSLNAKKQHKWLKLLPNIIEIAFKAISGSCSEEETEAFMNFFSKVCLHKKDLESYLPEDFCTNSWETLELYFSKRAKGNNIFLSPDMSNKTNVLNYKEYSERHCLSHLCHDRLQTYSVKEKDDLAMPNDLKGKEMFAASSALCDHLENLILISESERIALTSVVQMLTEEELKVIIQGLMEDIDCSVSDIALVDAVTFQMRLLIFRYLIDAAIEKNQSICISKLTQKVLTKLHFMMSQTCESICCLLQIVIPSLKFISFVLKKEKVNLPKQCVVQCLHSCIPINIEIHAKEPVFFIKVYMSVYNVLNEFLVHHSYIMLSTSAAFMTCVTMLLKSIIQAGNQDLVSTYDSGTRHEIQLCAQNLERLLTLISKNKKEFAKLVPYFVADYVDSVQNITVHPSVKVHLISGVNRVLDLCSEESLKMLVLNINHSCREIFSNLVKNYKQYRYSGHV